MAITIKDYSMCMGDIISSNYRYLGKHKLYNVLVSSKSVLIFVVKIRGKWISYCGPVGYMILVFSVLPSSYPWNSKQAK